MDALSAKLANDRTRLFYEGEAESFSASRGSSWRGWERVLGHVRSLDDVRSVLDIGCGNLRFERFLLCNGISPERIVGVDYCDELVAKGPRLEMLEHRSIDVVEALTDGALNDGIAPMGYDIAVAFGFMHHVPEISQRRNLLEAMVGSLDERGLAFASFWQLSKDEGILEKARVATAEAAKELGIDLDMGCGDYFLGWQGSNAALRFCHDFSDLEIDELTSGLNVIERFQADGKRGDLNSYIVLTR